jgi:hypothetical protein
MRSLMRKRCDFVYVFVAHVDFGDGQVIELNPLSHIGYNLKHAALHGAQRYDEAIATFQAMLSKLDDAPDTETRSKANNSCVSMA